MLPEIKLILELLIDLSNGFSRLKCTAQRALEGLAPTKRKKSFLRCAKIHEIKSINFLFA
jgi:hypothetical protein